MTHVGTVAGGRDAGKPRLAERQMGEFLKAMPKNEGGRPTETGADSEPVIDTPTLREIGITKKQSSQAPPSLAPGWAISPR